MTDHTPMHLEKYYTCYIERRLHIPYNPASARLTTGLLMLIALIQLKIIREYGSTLYVGLARAVSPTNTNFRLTFLLTRLQEALYEDLAV